MAVDMTVPFWDDESVDRDASSDFPSDSERRVPSRVVRAAGSSGWFSSRTWVGFPRTVRIRREAVPYPPPPPLTPAPGATSMPFVTMVICASSPSVRRLQSRSSQPVAALSIVFTEP